MNDSDGGQVGGVDLHTHTTASDGEFTPEELLDHAVKARLAAIAITDHDTTSGIPVAIAAQRPIELVPGIEISCDVSAGICHVLGYFIDHDSPYLEEPLQFLRKRRRERAEHIVDRLAHLGIMITIPARPDDASVGRPHIATALVQGGHVGSYDEAFYRFLADGKPAFVPGPKLAPAEAIDMILRAGGVPVLAHPHTFDNPEKIGTYARQGLCGLEANYGSYDETQKKRWRKIAAGLGLIATAGSDFHGKVRPNRHLGSVRGDINTLTLLREKRRPL